MSRSRRGYVAFAGTCLTVVMVGWLVCAFLSDRAEKDRIRVPYQQLRTALNAGDTNAALKLFAPEVRAQAHRTFRMVGNVAVPLNAKSAISISGFRVLVCPRRIVHFGIIPGGHTVEMIKVDGEWFFTGKVMMDWTKDQ